MSDNSPEYCRMDECAVKERCVCVHCHRRQVTRTQRLRPKEYCTRVSPESESERTGRCWGTVIYILSYLIYFQNKLRRVIDLRAPIYAVISVSGGCPSPPPPRVPSPADAHRHGQPPQAYLNVPLHCGGIVFLLNIVIVHQKAAADHAA